MTQPPIPPPLQALARVSPEGKIHNTREKTLAGSPPSAVNSHSTVVLEFNRVTRALPVESSHRRHGLIAAHVWRDQSLMGERKEMHKTLSFVAFATLAASASAQTLIGPTEYLSLADSPFAGFDGFFLEDMEDGLFNIPGVTKSAGDIIGPSSATDSVDADDGIIDGSGNNGHSLFGPAGITFTFDAAVIGAAPTMAGIVWTDGPAMIIFEAFDTMGNSLGVLTGTHGDAGFNGGTAEDRFYGIEFAGGIGSISIQSGNTIEVDHLQYVVPAPGAATLLGIAGILASRRRR